MLTISHKVYAVHQCQVLISSIDLASEFKKLFFSCTRQRTYLTKFQNPLYLILFEFYN